MRHRNPALPAVAAMVASCRSIVEELRAQAVRGRREFVPPVFDLTVVSASDEPSWKADDRAWFDAHPHRSMRLRPPGVGEGEDTWGDKPEAVLVKQYSPGARGRFPVTLGGRPIIDDEAFCLALYVCGVHDGSDTTPQKILSAYKSISRAEGAKQ